MSKKPNIIIALTLLAPGVLADLPIREGDLGLRSIGGWGVNLTDRDLSVSPGDDFNLYENGSWAVTAQIDPRKPANSYWGDLRVLTAARIGDILAEASANKTASADSTEGRLGAFYRSFMNVDRVRERGLKPMQARLDAIRRASKGDIAFLMGQFEGPLTERSISAPVQATGTGLLTVDVVRDPEDPQRCIASVAKAGLLLPSSDYYLDPRYSDVKAKYQDYIATQLRILRWEKPEENAVEIVRFETRIAEASKSDSTSPVRMSGKEFDHLSSDFDWAAYRKGAQLSKAEEVLADDRDALIRMGKVFADTPLSVLRARLAFALPDARARYLVGAPADARLAFRGTILNGQQVQLPSRESMAGDAVTANVGDLVGTEYLHKYFPTEYQDKASELVSDLRQAFDQRIANLNWMSPATKVKARKKLANMKIEFGDRSDLRTYSGLRFDPNDLYGNVERATTYNWQQKISRLEKGEPVLPTFMAVQTANYNYDASLNMVETPAGLFQSPFFDPNADPAVNYGSVGTIVALCMVQAFVGDSRSFDENGNHVENWWTQDEVTHFEDLAKRLADQYSAIEPIPGVHVKGDLLIPESLGDNGAISIALDAYHLSLNKMPPPVIDGFTGDQRFFMGRAQSWRAKFRPEFVRNQLATASNAPPFLRINGSVRNVDAWYDAFGVKPGDKMYLPPDQRVHIW